jgi:hypothetical protein
LGVSIYLDNQKARRFNNLVSDLIEKVSIKKILTEMAKKLVSALSQRGQVGCSTIQNVRRMEGVVFGGKQYFKVEIVT